MTIKYIIPNYFFFFSRRHDKLYAFRITYFPFMTGLILDTSTDLCLIGLSEKNQLIESIAFPHEQNLSKILLPSLHEIFKKWDLQLKDLSHISIGIGPGSYTGTRVGLAVAQSLSFGASLPLYSFCSLLAFLPPKLPQGPFAFLMASKHADIFLLKGFIEQGFLQKGVFQQLLPIQELKDHLEGVPLLLSFEPDVLLERCPSLSSLPSKWMDPEPNLSFLISYLRTVDHPETHTPEILYLHTIEAK